ncbi:CrcB family protein [Arsukibacterium sp. MJ3]|uniref:fluoride efflux transporter FluC n=1 Tax=Arsukibacterium sp. MJ3 TaxID=1632859 RepID=UPI00190FE95F|nr:CrcB family protein [Arsukibacterium sp. MJ3]
MSELVQSGGMLLMLALASACGGMLRYVMSGIVAKYYGVRFPLATLFVNSSGAFTIGIMAALIINFSAVANIDYIIVSGFLGSYTTVSSFSLQTLALWQSQYYRLALTNIGLSFGLCLGLVFAGFALGNWLC